VAEYAQLKDRFTAEAFDAEAICDLAVAAQMTYVNITSRHHDSFCLWDTKQTDFNSVNSPAKRDLVGELAQACRKRGLGLCLYYSHGRDWRHPHAPNNDGWGGAARPRYRRPDPHYATGAKHDLNKYLDFMKAQITELLTGYGPIANIWLDGIGTPLHPKGNNRKEMFRCQELYDHIRKQQPQVLVSYKQGLLGTEDFFAPEHRAAKARAGRPMEICTTLQQGSWGWKQGAPFLKVEQAMAKLANARAVPANLLLNVGPKGDGSIPPPAAAILREMGERIRRNGWPG
jgi:alpha-L-fucosidase